VAVTVPGMDLDWIGLRLMARMAPLIFVALLLYEPTRLWIFAVVTDVVQWRLDRRLEGTTFDQTT
jgi:hypothetical protein